MTIMKEKDLIVYISIDSAHFMIYKQLMAGTSKQTPLTVENFRKLLMPAINSQFTEVRENLAKIVHDMNNLKENVSEIKKRVKFLPTTEKYLASQDKLMCELKKSTEATTLTSQHYEDTNKRIDEIDKYLNINSRLAI